MTAPLPLPLPDDARLQALREAWQVGESPLTGRRYLWRSDWLREFEAVLREHYPQSSAKQLTLTARLAAPFPLAKPGVP